MHGKANNQPVKIRPNNSAPNRSSGRNFSSVPRSTGNWAEVDNQLLRDAVVAACDAGASIQFGKTSDGGANKLFVYDGDNLVKEYPRTVEEIEALLRWVVNMFTDG